MLVICEVKGSINWFFLCCILCCSGFIFLYLYGIIFLVIILNSSVYWLYLFFLIKFVCFVVFVCNSLRFLNVVYR